MNFSAEIVVLRVVPSAVVALEAGVLLQVFGDFVETRTLHTAHGCVGDEKFVLMFVDQVAIDFAGKFRVFGGLRQLAAGDRTFNLSEVIP